MSRAGSVSLVQKVHSAFWWVLLLLFASLVAAELLFDLSKSGLHRYGVILLAALTIVRAIFVAIELNRRGERNGVIWGIALVIVIGLAVLVGVVL